MIWISPNEKVVSFGHAVYIASAENKSCISCLGCEIIKEGKCHLIPCSSFERKDGVNVIFKEHIYGQNSNRQQG